MKFIHLIMVANVAIAGILCVTGCPQAVPGVAPVANLAACITSDALGGKSIVQIASDCGVDAEAVIVWLLGVTDPQLLASKAHIEALQLKAMLATTPSGTGK